MIECSIQFPQGSRYRHQTQSLVAHPCKIFLNPFVSSKNIVPERGSVHLVIQDHLCHLPLNLTRFLCITEGAELTLQVSLLSILLIGLIEIPHKNLLRSPRLSIDVSQIFPSASLKSPPFYALPIPHILFLHGGLSNIPSSSSFL